MLKFEIACYANKSGLSPGDTSFDWEFPIKNHVILPVKKQLSGYKNIQSRFSDTKKGHWNIFAWKNIQLDLFGIFVS